MMVALAPRSTWIHCGSLNALDQRVPALPSTAADAGKATVLSEDEAVAVLPWERSASAAAAGMIARQDVTRVTAAAISRAMRRPGLRDEGIASPRGWGVRTGIESGSALSTRDCSCPTGAVKCPFNQDETAYT
ncbi:hypothetical protein GCM10018952_70900 [Streptosporangium vulgare]